MSHQKTRTPQFENAPTTEDDLPWVTQLKRSRKTGPSLEQHNLISGDKQLATRCVHAGTYEEESSGAIGTPIFPSTTFRFSPTTYGAFLEGYVRDIPTYARYGSPSQWAVQLKIAALENAQSALVTSSGMAAISSSLIGLSNRNGHFISSFDLYGGSYNLLHQDLPQMGRSVTFVNPLDIDEITASIRPETQIMFFELLTNPLMKAIDLQAISALCKERDIMLIVDNTFLSPISCRPLDFGADVVIHSGTKYLNGHSDVTCGAVAGSRKLVDRVWGQMLKFGGNLDPLACFLLERGLKTLDIRMRTHADRAAVITQFLEAHPQIGAVYSPFSKTYPYEVLREYAPDLCTGMLSFEVNGGDAAALKFMDNLKLITTATSLGGVESLISLPFNTSHSGLTMAQQMEIGLNPGLVRLSVGIEDSKDICADLGQALDALEAKE